MPNEPGENDDGAHDDGSEIPELAPPFARPLERQARIACLAMDGRREQALVLQTPVDDVPIPSHPRRVEVQHGDEHESVTNLGRAREQEILQKSVEVLTKLTGGRRPIGYRAPAWQLSPDTLSLLVVEGFDYSSNMMDRLVPYLHPPIDGHSLVEIPVSWVLDDAPFFLFSGQRAMQAPGPVLQGWLTEFEGITSARGITNFTFHPQIIGRPSRLACLRELVDHALGLGRVVAGELSLRDPLELKLYLVRGLGAAFARQRKNDQASRQRQERRSSHHRFLLCGQVSPRSTRHGIATRSTSATAP